MLTDTSSTNVIKNVITRNILKRICSFCVCQENKRKKSDFFVKINKCSNVAKNVPALYSTLPWQIYLSSILCCWIWSPSANTIAKENAHYHEDQDWFKFVVPQKCVCCVYIPSRQYRKLSEGGSDVSEISVKLG